MIFLLHRLNLGVGAYLEDQLELLSDRKTAQEHAKWEQVLQEVEVEEGYVYVKCNHQHTHDLKNQLMLLGSPKKSFML